jgi:exodeoxyribonuclease-3
MTALTVMSYNIRYGGAGRENQLAEVIRACSPDVVLLQEAFRPPLVARLAGECGYEHFGSRRGQSTGFLSRLDVEHQEWQKPRGARHAFLELSFAGLDVHLVALHLSAWFSNWSERRRTYEIRALLHGIRDHQTGFHLIVGDFNALAPGERLELGRMPAWIRAMVWLSGNDIARATIQTMYDAGYVDTWRRRNGDDPGFTFPTWDPHVRLDYAFAPERDAERVTSCRVVTSPSAATKASDHFPLLLSLTGFDRD